MNISEETKEKIQEKRISLEDWKPKIIGFLCTW